MKVRNTCLPPARVDISAKDGRNATLTLWNGTYKETPVERPTEDGKTESSVEYEYELYQIRTTMRDNLEDAVNAGFDAWYSAAKTAEANAKADAELAELTREMQNSIPETMLDHDFRLMMLEELGQM